VNGHLQANTIMATAAMTMSGAPMINHQRPGTHLCPDAWTFPAPWHLGIVELLPVTVSPSPHHF
jgi:hypothetical protein